jgi:hypothetical protein
MFCWIVLDIFYESLFCNIFSTFLNFTSILKKLN